MMKFCGFVERSAEWALRAATTTAEDKLRNVHTQLNEEKARREAALAEADRASLALVDCESRLAAAERELRMLRGGGGRASAAYAHPRAGGVEVGEAGEQATERSLWDAAGDGSAAGGRVGGGGGDSALQAALRAREGELSVLSQRVAALERTRTNLSEELVKATEAAEAAEGATAAAAAAAADLAALRGRHASALELMGERDEQMEELKADLADSKQAYRDQVEMLLKQLEALQPK